MESSASIFVSIIPLVVVFGIMGFFIYVLVDILKSEFTNSVNKIIWLILVLVTGPLGIVLYFNLLTFICRLCNNAVRN